MFKDNNKKALERFTPFSNASVIDFKQLNVCGMLIQIITCILQSRIWTKLAKRYKREISGVVST